MAVLIAVAVLLRRRERIADRRARRIQIERLDDIGKGINVRGRRLGCVTAREHGAPQLGTARTTKTHDQMMKARSQS
jgi:hypothetical protein